MTTGQVLALSFISPKLVPADEVEKWLADPERGRDQRSHCCAFRPGCLLAGPQALQIANHRLDRIRSADDEPAS